MFGETSTILSSDQPDNNPEPGQSEPPRSPLKKIFLLATLILAVLVLAAAVYFIFRKLSSARTPAATPKLAISASSTVASSASATLPVLNSLSTATTTNATSSFSDLQIEYMSFADFYRATSSQFTSKILDYSLPLNVKVDVMNYYDISRKLNLDPGLNQLNNQGLTVIDNPWPQQAPDFYSIYSNLSAKQIPLLITSDFIIYNYQNILKKSFKDIEASVFYNNLWDITEQMYSVAKTRYEARLASIGDINDSILEGERLETAFFAVALELLKPASGQISAGNTAPDARLFTKADADTYYFVLPPYLRDDVLAEENLIRGATALQAKSPVMLYQRNYQDFKVPDDYRANAKLNNFYLTTKWLNSVFPLNYRDKNCPNCLLDQADWRINLTAASLIAQDFSLAPELKNKWARIYKVMSFFKGLREDLSYVNYRDALSSLFGTNYDVTALFSDQNKQAAANLEKFRTQLLGNKFPMISGGLDRSPGASPAPLGFRLLAESYWPNDYIFSHLLTPAVTTYLGTSTQSVNITACQNRLNWTEIRCNGFALDPINLVYPIVGNPYFSENTNYLHYNQGVASLQADMAKSNLGHLNNYWTTLSLLGSFLAASKTNLPAYAQSPLWQDTAVRTAAATWINLQLPLANLTAVPTVSGQSIGNLVQLDSNSYVEPNLNLLNELLANDDMLLGMFSALQLDTEVPEVFQNIKNFSANLLSLQQIMIKELTSQTLTAADNALVANFAKQFQVNNYTPANQQLYLSFPNSTLTLKEDLSQLRLLVLVHQDGDNKVFSVGPIWSYQEGH